MADKIVLPKYKKSLFVENVVTIAVSQESLHSIDLWWQEVEAKSSWISRFEATARNFPAGPERSDARKAFRGCRELFERVNMKLAELLQMKSGNPIMKFWIYPILSLVRARPETRIVDNLIDLIDEFDQRYWTTENDIIIAVYESVGASPTKDELERAQLVVAQAVFEEFVRSLPLQELFNAFNGIEEQNIIDDLETELVDIRTALASGPWSSRKREMYRRRFNTIREAMDLLKCETGVKTGFNRAFAYATDHEGESVSIFDIMTNMQKTWDGFVNDPDLREFWGDKQARLEGTEE
ncbi:MAG: hypothetical protein UW68_C0031G0005 [Candidatus Collierbacteria bacterium GW2011_GWB1_44_6]|uniref:Uncharacterized protein n=2 Tax=Candidatus Collieribacteriota TaxID=1752725 RepID=A0A0G1JMM9_9BACT|nr:MAG: hypothetical protein UV68_C0044G0006 [Candidatus Collierbacteria bacterium GW2011_GWC2_43_12]KKT72610.1 MAG: hypothetical protein UW68_C0031G0005 [Candidatus Collierbacteria bacterium GW2011_GWB1_44_6]KKT81847.1 MAG: hypothetical protein UW80_C0046G0007 [Microgenomates group bacterium GW2011_GWC1_44_9]